MPADALRDRYRNPIEIHHGPEGIRYTASLADGTAVVVLVLAPDLSARIRHPDRFFETLKRASLVQGSVLSRPLTWGRTTEGSLHVAYPAEDDAQALSGPLSPSAVALIGTQLTTALAMAHAAGLVHGALTPGRIAQTRTGDPRLLHFGLLAALVAGGAAAREASAVLCDKPYISPEVQADDVPDQRSDIFSLGASLYELLTGKPPYGGRTTVFMLATVLADVDQETSMTETTSPVVDALVRAIERRPDDRWTNATSFAQALNAARVPGLAKGSSRGSRWRGCLPGAAACVVLAALAGFAALR